MSDKTCGSCSPQGGGGCQQHQQEQEDQRLQQRLSRIRNKLVILSGKGGVGKSSVATNVAVGLAQSGYSVGLLDVDVHGPSVPRLLSLTGSRIQTEEGAIQPVAWSENLSVMSLGFLLPGRDDSVIWRGPLKMSLIRQFLEDVAWGDLDYLIVDCPPGTGDEPLSVLQLLGGGARAVVVTTPQDIAIDDVRRSVNFCSQTGNPVLGVVENMSGFVCPHCQQEVDIFHSGGGETMAAEMGVPFLGRIPLDPELVRSGDEGYAFLRVHRDSPTARAIETVLGPIVKLAEQQVPAQEEAGPATDLSRPQPEDNGLSKIAVPVANGQLCMHFGHCEQFALISVDPESRAIHSADYLTPPPHEPGVLPKWLAEQKVGAVIAGGMGSRALSYFQDYGVRVVTGARGGTPEELVRAYLEGTLETGANVCDH
jgi:Mrp family chromosome partitioning ATPase/predicted Fe-Mo cluster-binding NifX family protein